MVEAEQFSDRIGWQSARIESIDKLTPSISRVVLRPEAWHRPLAGQHLDIRLTAPDGYQAQRGYSLLSPPEREGVYELAIERLSDGEVSPWFHDSAQVGDSIEILGPVGLHFVWRSEDEQPTLLIGSGSGVVPLLAMAAHHVHSRSTSPMVLIVAVRTMVDVVMWSELQRWEALGRGFHSRLALSRDVAAPRAQDRIGRLRAADIAAALQRLGDDASGSAATYVCGSNSFVESVTGMLRELCVPDGAVRTERFGGGRAASGIARAANPTPSGRQPGTPDSDSLNKGFSLAHGANEKLVGKDMIGLKDANGVLITKGLIAVAGKGGGWFDYDWPDPVSKKVMAKSTYVAPLPAGGGLLGVGVYK